ncbi:hypothetical protein D8S78_24050 [Natrialba swarupiae]|nr:hypothetical protein [Natrialba swarupiae]
MVVLVVDWSPARPGPFSLIDLSALVNDWFVLVSMLVLIPQVPIAGLSSLFRVASPGFPPVSDFC